MASGVDKKSASLAPAGSAAGAAAAGAGAKGANFNQSVETFQIVHEISKVLNTGLDQETLGLLIALCECGVNPEALAAVVKELTREAAAINATPTDGAST